MTKKNDDFFVEKKPWSEVKDQLLGCYGKTINQNPIRLQDTLWQNFAGKII